MIGALDYLLRWNEPGSKSGSFRISLLLRSRVRTHAGLFWQTEISGRELLEFAGNPGRGVRPELAGLHGLQQLDRVVRELLGGVDPGRPQVAIEEVGAVAGEV